MNKQQLLDLLDGYSASGVTIVSVGTPIQEEVNEHFDSIYRVNIKKVMTAPDRVNYENIRFVVEQEGLAGEKAYFYRVAELRFENKNEQGNIVGL
jgi:hypothetical protein